MFDSLLLQDQVVFITGASRGIGRQVALTCAKAGATVVVGARSQKGHQSVVDQISAQGGKAYGVDLDVTIEDKVKQAVEHIINRSECVDALINCAGIIQYDTPVWQTSIEDWDRMMQVNLRGTFLTCHAVAPFMVQKGKGKIVNLASSSARMADDDLGPYTASKWAVAGYATSLARSLRPHGVRVNCVNPGWVDTDMSRAYQAEGDSEWSTPQEIANAVLYLLTLAPRDMTGQFLDIFGS